MKVAISGSNGYIAGALRPAIERAGHTIELERFDHDVLIHTYALTNLYECEKDYRRSLEMNVVSTVKACKAMIGRKLIYLSSNTANDSWGDTRSVYDKHKCICEEIIQSCPDLDYVILRLDTVYGYSPNESREGRGIINRWIKRAMEDGDIVVYRGVTDKLRDYVHIDDVVSAIVEAIHSPTGMYDVSSGDRRSILGAANTIAHIVGSGRVKIIDEPDGLHPIDYRSLSRPNLRWLPNWTPKIDFVHGVDKTMRDYAKA